MSEVSMYCLLDAARVLCKESWPENPLERALYGEQDVALLCKIFHFHTALWAEIVLEYSLYKLNGFLGANLKRLVKLLEVLPVTSAECERGFSQMNLYHTASRNRLVTSTVSDLLMIGINGPPVGQWNATKYVVSWLKAADMGHWTHHVVRQTEKLKAPLSANCLHSTVALVLNGFVYFAWYILHCDLAVKTTVCLRCFMYVFVILLAVTSKL
jgi:hypothetical protein